MITVDQIEEGQTGLQVSELLFANDSALAEGINSATTVLGEPETLVLPSPTWLSQAWNAPSQAGLVFLDIRNEVTRDVVIKKFNAHAATAGSVRIGFYDKATLVRTSYQDFTLALGLNSFAISFTNENPHYVAFEGIVGEISLIFPTTGNVYGRGIAGGVLTTQDYPFAYTIETADISQTLAGRVTALEAVVGSAPTSDINAALADGDVTLLPIDYYLDETIVVPAGRTLRGSFGKTRIFMNGVSKGIHVPNIESVKLADFELIGTLPNYSYAMNGMIAGSGYTLIENIDQAIALTYMGSETGIHLESTENFALHNIRIRNVSGFALHVEGVGKTYIKGAKLTDSFITNCYGGIRTENEHEYCQYSNWSITLCQIAVSCASGNLQFNNMSCTRGMIGMLYKAGTNHAHGQAAVIEAKHNQIAGIVCDSIAYGQQFLGAYLSYCDLVIRNSRGCFFSPAMFEGGAGVVCTGSYVGGIAPAGGGKNVIQPAMCTHGVLSVTGGGNIIVADIYNGLTA